MKYTILDNKNKPKGMLKLDKSIHTIELYLWSSSYNKEKLFALFEDLKVLILKEFDLKPRDIH
ncbi:MAG: hypothetical protein AABY22_18565 [Nanoarchaeota archaeon]